MKNYVKKILALIIGGCMVFSGVGCNKGGNSSSSTKTEKTLVLPTENEFISFSTWNDDMFEAYIRPYWYSREIYNETVVFIGEEGEAPLMYEPTEVNTVRSYDLLTDYVDGKDYVIEGRKIKRVKGSSMPYWEPDEYFLTAPNSTSVVINVNHSTIDEGLDMDYSVQRFLRYAEGTVFTSKQVAITYRTNELYDGVLPKGQREKVADFVNKVEAGQDVNIMIYGPSTGVGCNASGTSYGGNINPYMPAFYDILVKYIEKTYNIKVNLMNEAVGGWTSKDLVSNYDKKIRGKEIDLMFFVCPGSNDSRTGKDSYSANLFLIFQKFFNDYPEANLIVQTPSIPNEQSTWVGDTRKMPNWVEEVVAESVDNDRIAISRVDEIYSWMNGKGKKGRDLLANNINHFADFALRVYVQCALKAIFGNDYVEEIYE